MPMFNFIILSKPIVFPLLLIRCKSSAKSSEIPTEKKIITLPNIEEQKLVYKKNEVFQEIKGFFVFQKKEGKISLFFKTLSVFDEDIVGSKAILLKGSKMCKKQPVFLLKFKKYNCKIYGLVIVLMYEHLKKSSILEKKNKAIYLFSDKNKYKATDNFFCVANNPNFYHILPSFVLQDNHVCIKIFSRVGYEFFYLTVFIKKNNMLHFEHSKTMEKRVGIKEGDYLECDTEMESKDEIIVIISSEFLTPGVRVHVYMTSSGKMMIDMGCKHEICRQVGFLNNEIFFRIKSESLREVMVF